MPSNLNILYEDNHIIAVNKTVSDLVQKDSTGDLSLDEKVKNYIREKYKKPGKAFLGVVHRIDRPVSGAVLFARTSKALTRLNKMFKEGSVSKTYWAIVKDRPPESSGTLLHYLVRDASKNKSFCFDNPKPSAKKAVLHYTLITQSDHYFLLEVDLETGRHHQIRCQLAHIGCPIKGDLKYGFPRSNENGGISLHARKVSFIHPVKKEALTITADPDMSDPLWSYFLNTINSDKGQGTRDK
ncbi:MAG: RluA family pseudouridine synthase [Bacteroidales bacterium]|nr:RluA family pseudouridine synthase [Bacteroidales bacterium]